MDKIKISLGKLGEINTITPSLGSIMEFVTLWATHGGDPSILARVCSGTIGICTDHLSILPRYRPAIHKPLEYGYLCLERLLEKGIPSSKIYEAGSQLLAQLADHLPKEEEIEDTMGFFPQNLEASKD